MLPSRAAYRVVIVEKFDPLYIVVALDDDADRMALEDPTDIHVRPLSGDAALCLDADFEGFAGFCTLDDDQILRTYSEIARSNHLNR